MIDNISKNRFRKNKLNLFYLLSLSPNEYKRHLINIVSHNKGKLIHIKHIKRGKETGYNILQKCIHLQYTFRRVVFVPFCVK